MQHKSASFEFQSHRDLACKYERKHDNTLFANMHVAFPCHPLIPQTHVFSIGMKPRCRATSGKPAKGEIVPSAGVGEINGAFGLRSQFLKSFVRMSST